MLTEEDAKSTTGLDHEVILGKYVNAIKKMTQVKVTWRDMGLKELLRLTRSKACPFKALVINGDLAAEWNIKVESLEEKNQQMQTDGVVVFSCDELSSREAYSFATVQEGTDFCRLVKNLVARGAPKSKAIQIAYRHIEFRTRPSSWKKFTLILWQIDSFLTRVSLVQTQQETAALTQLEKPSLDEVLKYAKRQASIYSNKYASSLPKEQRDEIEQDVMLRVIRAYKHIDSSKGWKSFVQRHASGAAFDYIRGGHGFEESELPRKDPETGEEVQDKKPYRLQERVSKVSPTDGVEQSLDQILGQNDVYDVHYLLKKTRPRWELIARMASQDNDIHLVGKLLLGFSQTELCSMFKVSRERLTQRFAEFCYKLDAPEYLGSRWIAQTIFAFGLCHEFSMPDRDLGFGWEYEKIDLWSTEDNYIEQVNPQMAFEFDWN